MAFTVATFFGIGKAPLAPGTFGSLGALFLWWGLGFNSLSFISQFLLVIVVLLLGTGAISLLKNDLKQIDAPCIVIDEVAGMWVVLMAVPQLSFYWGFLSFLFFRVFDILKPWPCSWVDKKLKNSPGVMLDDLIAGLYAIALLTFVQVAQL